MVKISFKRLLKEGGNGLLQAAPPPLNCLCLTQRYRVTHKGWDFKDDCTEFIVSVFLYLRFPASLNLFLSMLNHLKPH